MSVCKNSPILKILYQDDAYLAIDKPAGLLVHRTQLAASETVSALQLLRDQINKTVYPCHRLDRPTSGILLFALSLEALRFAQKEFQAQRVSKTYHAIVRGWLTGTGQIDYDLRSEDNPKRIDSAVTEYRGLSCSELPTPVGRYPQARFSRVELKPKTGRKHQLRRHLAHLRHPILGDTRHGDGAQNRFLRDDCEGQHLMLRAMELRIAHPEQADTLDLVAEPDLEYERICQKLNLGITLGEVPTQPVHDG